MPYRARLLGFAFANADLLFEVSRNGEIVFATGAQRDIAHGKPLVGLTSKQVFEPRDDSHFLSYVRGLAEGGRCGPVRLKLVGGADVDVAMCRLPQNNGVVSCTLGYSGLRGALAASSGADAQTGLANRDSFLAKVSKPAQPDEKLAVVEVADLAKLPQDQADTVLSKIGQAIAQSGIETSGRVSETGFGAIVRRGAHLAQVVKKALSDGGLGDLQVAETLVSLKSNGLTSDQRMLALRYAVDKISGGGTVPQDIGKAFDEIVQETEAKAIHLTNVVAEGKFSMAYQPIVELKTGEVAHYEALTRFESANTQEMIEFAESLRISDAFDLAVAVKVLGAVEALGDRSPSVAFNMSGHTLSTPSSFGMLAGLLLRRRKLARKVLIEITETAAITDLQSANEALQTLRSAGFRAGLDDFGAGAASFQYLHAFNVDFVKIDGSLIKNIGQSKRDDQLLKSIVSMCHELNIETIAEFVSEEHHYKLVKEMGFHLGQGHYFSKAGPILPPLQDKVRARRMGVRESWG
ncbi:MAG TPA: EAL domain-containing protein [Rhizomicrobium sp.]|jgi:EAL domain-containing protein (putative c-di-GMP-specific phosphodiesterase class I)|nr:EAL domain-containing protein [Rhizomicrobium sp.]